MLNRFALFFQFLLIGAVVFLKLRADSAYFLTPDSHFYIQAAQNLLDGKGYRIVFEGKETFCAIWPIGYSTLIAFVSWLTSFSIETASKIVNLLALAGCFWLIGQRFQQKAWFVALAFSASSLIQLYTNTWSETVFLFFVLGFCTRPLPLRGGARGGVLWAIGAFLTRYAGVFLLIPLLIQRKFRAAVYYSLFIGGYLFFNLYRTGTFTGGHGFWPEEPFGERLLRGIRGLGEEFLFFGVRDWGLKQTALRVGMQWFIYGVAFLQCLIAGLIGWKWYKVKDSDACSMTKNVFFPVAVSYLFFTIAVYLTDASVESLYFRRLAPASLLFALGLLARASEQKVIFEQTKWLFVTFFALSIIHALPK
ncbi:MAG: hypothetical protein U0X91_30400 [Spirosomataceae bacterium]